MRDDSDRDVDTGMLLPLAGYSGGGSVGGSIGRDETDDHRLPEGCLED